MTVCVNSHPVDDKIAKNANLFVKSHRLKSWRVWGDVTPTLWKKMICLARLSL